MSTCCKCKETKNLIAVVPVNDPKGRAKRFCEKHFVELVADDE